MGSDQFYEFKFNNTKNWNYAKPIPLLMAVDSIVGFHYMHLSQFSINLAFPQPPITFADHRQYVLVSTEFLKTWGAIHLCLDLMHINPINGCGLDYNPSHGLDMEDLQRKIFATNMFPLANHDHLYHFMLFPRMDHMVKTYEDEKNYWFILPSEFISP